MSGEYVEDGKQYQTEGDEEIIAYDSGSQENGKQNLQFRVPAWKQ